MTRLSLPSGNSLVARAAPRTAPTEYPILNDLIEISEADAPAPQDLRNGGHSSREPTVENPKIRRS